MIPRTVKHLLACGGLAFAIALSPVQAQNVKVKLVLPAVSVLFTPVYIAKDAGYFEDEGLDVELSVMGGPAALNSLIGGSGDFTTIAGFLQLRAAQRGQKTLAIANLQEKSTTEIVLSKSATEKVGANAKTPVERAKALKGLTLAVDAANGLPHAYLRYVARQAGLDPERDIRLVFMSPPGMDAALQKGEVDGFAFSSPFTLEAVRRGAHMWISGPNGDFPDFNPSTYNVLLARDGYCQSAPNVCRSMVAALNRGMGVVAQEPEKALALIGKRFERMDPELLQLAYESFRRNAPAQVQPMAQAFERTIETTSGPSDNKAALRELAKTLYTDEYMVGVGK